MEYTEVKKQIKEMRAEIDALKHEITELQRSARINHGVFRQSKPTQWVEPWLDIKDDPPIDLYCPMCHRDHNSCMCPKSIEATRIP